MATGTLSVMGLATIALLTVVALLVQRMGRRRLAGCVGAIAVGLTALSVLRSEPRPLAAQPFPDAHEVTEVTWRMVHGEGYTVKLKEARPRSPRYAPGYPIALAPFALVGRQFPGAILRGPAFYAASYVVAVSLAAWTMGGPAAAALAALVVGASPFVKVMASMVMSDAFGAGLTMIFIPLVYKASRNRAMGAGLLAGFLVASRLPMILNLPALFFALPRSLWKPAILGAAVPLCAYGLFNHITYGSPLTTGYHLYVQTKNLDVKYVANPHSKEGSWVTPDALDGWIVKQFDRRPPSAWPMNGAQAGFPNYILYPAVLSGVFWVFTPPLFSLIGLWSFWRDRDRPEARFALVVCASSLLFFFCYFYQGSRFMAAPASLLLAGASAQIARWCTTRRTISKSADPARNQPISRPWATRRKVTSGVHVLPVG